MGPYFSDKTDIESTHSSNLSGYPEKGLHGEKNLVGSAIPPDALYATSEKHRLYQHQQQQRQQQQHLYIHDAVFNDSKVRQLPESFV